MPTSSPLPFFAYPFLVLTFAGWIVALVKEPALTTSTAPVEPLHEAWPRATPRGEVSGPGRS